MFGVAGVWCRCWWREQSASTAVDSDHSTTSGDRPEQGWCRGPGPVVATFRLYFARTPLRRTIADTAAADQTCTRGLTMVHNTQRRQFNTVLSSWNWGKIVSKTLYWCTVDCDLASEHFKQGTTINSPHCEEFMVWRIFSVVLIFLSPLMDEFTL